MTHAWTNELARNGLRVNSLGAETIEPPIYSKTELSDETVKTHKGIVMRSLFLGRIGQPYEVVGLPLSDKRRSQLRDRNRL